jgi:hypothetical protein
MPSADDVSTELRKRDESEHSFQLDGWVRWDMPGDFTEYYDLVQEPERFTDYQGQRVWKFIHERICFQLQLEADGNAWKNDFNRFISGMHSAVSVHIVGGMPEEQQLAEYRRRLRDQKGAVQNLHFGYMLFLCAIRQVSPRPGSNLHWLRVAWGFLSLSLSLSPSPPAPPPPLPPLSSHPLARLSRTPPPFPFKRPFPGVCSLPFSPRFCVPAALCICTPSG